jgi:DNA-binding GntR family transcriptional regulator
MKDKPSPNLSSEIFNVLKDRIIRWQYPRGHRLTEEGLCEEFGVSRSPIREALRRLVENSLVDKEPHRCYSVRQLNMEEIHELYDVRQALELYVVERLTQQGVPPNAWQELYDSWSDVLKKFSETRSDIAEMDEKFHETLANWTGNKTLAQQLHEINERLTFIRTYDITSIERLQITRAQHLRILDCIQNKDIICSRKALQENIQIGRENVESAVKEALANVYMDIKVSA